MSTQSMIYPSTIKDLLSGNISMKILVIYNLEPLLRLELKIAID